MNYYGYTDYETASTLGVIMIIIFLVVILISMTISLIQLIGMWKLFKKAGKGGWESLIPFYNYYVLIEISGLNWWWFLIYLSPIILYFIPGIALLATLIPLFTLFNCYYNLSKKFNKGIGFAFCLTFFPPICIPILGFSKNCVYNNVPVSNNGVFGPSGNNNNGNYQNQSMSATSETNNFNSQNINNEQSQQFSFCGNCGNKLDSNVRFCPNCGKERI